MPVELFSNPPTPGGATPWVIATLSQAITTAPASGTVESWNVSVPAPTVLRSSQSAQFRALVDNEIIIVTASSTGASPWTVTRGAEGSTPGVHASGVSIYHVLTAGALNNISSSLIIDTTASDFQMDGTATAGSTGKIADAGHIHPTDTSRAPLVSPAFTGVPTAPTQTALDDSTKLATTAYADGAVSVEKTRAETAEALLAPKASPMFTGAPTAPTQATLDNSTKLATTAYSDSAVAVEQARAEATEATKAPLVSPALTGSPTAPTQAALDNSTKLATTAYADSAVGVEKTRALSAEGLLAPKASPTFTGIVTAPEFTASGLTGATAASRYVGATASGAPATGTFAVGDYIIDQSGKVWVCTAAGTPGTWANAGASAGVSSFNTRTGAVTPGNADYLAVATGGLTGATAAARFVGGTASGAPASGTFAVGDFAVAQNGAIWVCTAAGSPGTWVEIPPEAVAPSGPGGTAGGNTGAAQTIPSPTTFNQWWGVMNAATVTITLPAGVAGGLFQVRLDQDATGGRILAFAANPTFPGYASATAALAKINAQSAAAAEIWLTFVCVDGSTWQAFPALPQGRAVVSVTSGASITPALQGPQDHIFVVSALAAAMTVNAITGSPVDGQKVEFRLAQNGTGGFAITWNAAFTTANTALITWPSEPTTASATWKELYEWNASTSKWERLAMV